MSQSTILSATDSAEASQPELEASSDQGISLSDLSPSPAANDESDETPLALAKKTIKDNHLVLFMTWIFENKMAVSGWVVALLSLVVTIIAMVPGFRSESMSQRALELAEWTALKDFIENCKQDHQVGLASVACQEAISQPLPPPPHMRMSSSIIERGVETGCNCKQRDESAVNTTIALMACLMLATLFTAIYEIWHTKSVENTKSQGVKLAKQTRIARGIILAVFVVEILARR